MNMQHHVQVVQLEKIGPAALSRVEEIRMWHPKATLGPEKRP